MNNALNYSNSIVQRLHCTNEDKQKTLSCLRNTAFKDLLKAYDNRYTKPIIDNYFFPLYPPLAIQNGTYNNVSLIMGNNDYEQPICHQHPFMNFKEAIALLSQSIEQKWLQIIVDYYHLNNCSSERNANITRCCNIVRLILMDKIYDCDIRRIFNAFYRTYDREDEKKKLFSYHLNCYPRCPLVTDEGICRHSSELPFVFGTVSDADSHREIHCKWKNQSRIFSNGIISHWINIATTGIPLNQWPIYDPSMPQYFYFTPDHNFSPVTWNRNCSFFNEMETKGVLETFGNHT
ncbi:unnamed protein product [Adineta steineri]|nr:unnamed protein product [Adineta steineri]